MRAPEFWDSPSGCLDWRSRLLAPLGWLYAAATARRLSQGTRYWPGAPVICVGNLSAGGTGKTPAVAWLAQNLRVAGYNPQVVTRGYGGKLAGPVPVDPARHSAAEIGDEALLLAAFAPVWVARDRSQGALAAVRAGATVVVLDDGFQDASLYHDFALVVADAQQGFGNSRCIPAGPLREPVATGLARADCLLTLGNHIAQGQFDTIWEPKVSICRYRGQLQYLKTGIDWRGLSVLAFAGIGRPQKFFAMLRSLGAHILEEVPLADHQPLTSALMARLKARARMLDAQLVTTEKDAARLPPAYRTSVISLPVRLQVERADELLGRISAAISTPGLRK